MYSKKQSVKKLGAVAMSAAALAFLAWITPGNYYQMMTENDFIRSLKKKLSAYNEQRPQERLYLQFDKPMYEPGDNIWFSAFIRDAISLKPSLKSDIIHVEFLNPKGTIEKSINIIAKNGVAAGDFNLGQEALGGVYKVRAYTNWMKNEGENNFFEKEFQVQELILPNLKMKLDFERKAFGAGDEVIAKLELNTNENTPLSNHKIKYVANLNGAPIVTKSIETDEDGLTYIKFELPKDLKSNDGLLNVMIDYNGSTESISRSIPIVLNKIKLELFPEGGDLVLGLESKVAFRALNEFGKPADITAMVVNSKGEKVADLSSFHMGMGAFSLTPVASETYSVRILKPENISETFSLPQALSAGYVMNVESKPLETAVTINSSFDEELSVVAQVRNKVYYTTVVDAKKGENRIVFPTSKFPAGVSQITLFDSKGIARAERLAFVNKDKQLNISVETEKEKYLPREKVKMKITVKDERGVPMPGTFSMAVVNDQYLSFADDKTGNILSQLLLEQDINQKVEEPAFYFSKKEKKADEALDYLLMTAGWRHFTWGKVMQEELPAVAYAGERAIVAGTVVDAYTGRPLPNAKIKINNGAEYQTDESGKFIFNKLDLTSPVNLTYQTSGYSPQSQQVQQYAPNLMLYLYNNNVHTYSTLSAAENDMIVDAPAALGPDNLDEVMVVSQVKRLEKRSANKVQRAQPRDAQNNKQEPMPAGMPMPKLKKEEFVAGKVDVSANQHMWARMDDLEDVNKNIFLPQQQVTVYYRAREFSAPVYAKDENVENRTDFRNTIYWNPGVEVDRSGNATVEFYTSDDITSFRATLEGVATDGSIGRAEKNIFTQLPFAMTTKIPVEVATEDNVSIPLTLKNNTDKPLGGLLTVTAPDGLQALTKISGAQTIMPGAAKTIYLDYKVLDKIGYGDFTLSFKACGLGDAMTQKIRISPKGFPVQASFSGQEVEKKYSFEVKDLVSGSLRAKFTAFPNVVGDLMKGVEGILQEPYGCFEQTSCTAYPNAMVLDYLKTTDSKDNKTMARAIDLLQRGYKRLTTFEASKRGYEWFGADPGHEGLTAYGLMEFTDMKQAGAEVDQKMIDRTAQWLMQRKDGKGGFAREAHAYHDFGRISNDILNAYIVYALSDAGYADIKKEFESSYAHAMSTKDPYLLAMMASAAYNLNEASKADNAMAALIPQQQKDGSFNGATHSITYSQGNSLKIETTSLAVLSILKNQGKQNVALNNAIQYLVSSRSGSGVFGSTQGTILALKAMTEFAKASKKTTESGTIEIYVDGKKAAEKKYSAGDKGAIEIAGLEQFLAGEGKHDVTIKYVGVKTPLPYAMSVDWSTSLPTSDKECNIDLSTKLASKTAMVGETVRLTATITNKRSAEVPSTMAIIGIPAGFSVQPWQLKELQDKKVFDYYEMKGNNIAIYYRGMAASAVKQINLDLKAEMPGVYDAPASSAYLYYTNEYKTWSGMDRITIKKNG
jgi:hypothetical protein